MVVTQFRVTQIVFICCFVVFWIGFGESQFIRQYTALYGYKNGETLFTIIGEEFEFTPDLYIASTKQELISSDIDADGDAEIVWKIRNPNRLDKNTITIVYGSRIIFPEDTAYFNFITPSITSFTPKFYYPKGLDSQVRLTINGQNLILMDGHPEPEVKLNGVALTVVSFSTDQVVCLIPNDNLDQAAVVLLVVYPYGLSIGIKAPDLFKYSLPRITGVEPKEGISDTQIITISGGPFVQYPQTFSILVGGQNCAIQQRSPTKTVCQFTNTLPVAPGEFINLPITAAIDGQTVYGNHHFTIVKPLIEKVYPSTLYTNTESEITIIGRLVGLADSVMVGTASCDISVAEFESIICNLDGIDNNLVGNFPVSIFIDNLEFQNEDVFIEFAERPSIGSFEPNMIYNQGVWELNIILDDFTDDNYVFLNGQQVKAEYIYDELFKIKLDPRELNLANGDYQLTIKSKNQPSIESDPVTISVVDPVVTFKPNSGYRYSETEVEIQFQNFPIQLNDKVFIEISFDGGRYIDSRSITFVDTNTMKFKVPPQLEDNTNAITKVEFSIPYNSFQMNFQFTYNEPSFTAFNKPDLVNWQGGGYFELIGDHLNVIDSIKVGDDEVFWYFCSISDTNIKCDIPSRPPGKYPIIYIGKDSFDQSHEYAADVLFIEYKGPAISKVKPSRGSKYKQQTLIIDGMNLLDDQQLVQVMVGTHACDQVEVITPNTQISCILGAMDDVGELDIVVTVDGIASDVALKYFSYSLSCLGQSLEDNTNDVVDWWFIYRLHKDKEESYLYIDSKTPELGLYKNLQHTSKFNWDDVALKLSPIEATYSQNVPYYMFYSDQVGERKDNGARDDYAIPKPTKEKVGHAKGIVFWEEIGQKINSIHIHHSIPVFPSYFDSKKDSYNGPNIGRKFLGRNDFSQHMFCYSSENLEQITEYMVKNYVYVFARNVFNDLATSPTRQANFPYLYDLFVGQRALSEGFKFGPDGCQVQIGAGNTDLLNHCYWVSNPTIIGNGLNARYFMKIGTIFEFIIRDNVPKSDYILIKTSDYKYWDGVDLWMVVADTFRKKMFVQMFHAKTNYEPGPSKYPMQPTVQVLNVAQLELPKKISPNGNRFVIESLNNEHAKLGFPMYPRYAQEAHQDNDNYFCVGDNNRHNGQGQRGGGVICFQHDTLVYQFNRMVRKYNTYSSQQTNTRNVHTTLNNGAISLFYSTSQKVKVARSVQHPNVKCEVMDFINNQYYSKSPKQYFELPIETIESPFDGAIDIQALRTSRTNVAPNGEISVTTPPGATQDNDQIDILNYVANDILSLHYIAYDKDIGSICDYVNNLAECSSDNARVSLIPTTDNQIPDYPPANPTYYLMDNSIRNFQLGGGTVLDFDLMYFTSVFRTAFSEQNNFFFQFLVDPNAVIPNHFDPPYIVRRTNALCYDDWAYYVTLNFIFAHSDSEDGLIYKIRQNPPNWANGVIFAIATKLLNTKMGAPTTAIEPCFSVVPGFDDIETYSGEPNNQNPDDSVLFKRSASAAWDWMNPNYDDGANARRTEDDTIPYDVLFDLLIQVTNSESNTVESMAEFFYHIDVKYRTEFNFKTILERNYITPISFEGTDIIMFQMKMPTLFKSSNILESTLDTEVASTAGKSPMFEDERSTKSGIHQLVLTQTMDASLISSLNIYQSQKLELAIDKWITIRGKSQAIQTLILDPINQYHNQPIKFIQELNHYQRGNPIDLKQQSVGTTGNRITLTSPQSIMSITFILQSMLGGGSARITKFGDFEVYYIPKPDSYKGYITSDFDGIIISTINSQLCDIQMISETNFQSNNFDSICSGIGPVVISVNQLRGQTQGGYPITINGIRFNSSMIVSIGENECDLTELISPQQIICKVPNGVGKNNEIQLSTMQSIFNIQRTRFIFSYDSPAITDIKPDIIKNFGDDFMTIIGSNFGDDISNVNILIDDNLECSPIINITSNEIICLSPTAIGDHRTITVMVDDQKSTFNIGNLDQQSFSFDGPSIIAFVPQSGDPNDKIVILGTGFEDPEDSNDIPLLYIDDNLIKIDNFTSSKIEFGLDYDTSTQPLIIQSGDQNVVSEFNYYPALMTQVAKSDIQTTGGLFEIDGAGFGISYDNVKVQLNTVDIECNSFNEFIECYIPPGIGSNLPITATLSNEEIEMVDNFTISYLSPQIEDINIPSDGTIQIFGTNFVPVDMGVSFNPINSYINLIFEDRNQTCTSFKSSKLAECTYTNSNSNQPQSIEIIVAGQHSNIYTFE